ncbi:MAG: hypothetical protein ACTSR2_02095 [Candidatus Hodarchaeales archaeon]
MKKYNKEYYWKNPEYHKKRVRDYYKSLSPEEKKKRNEYRRLSGMNKRYYLKFKKKNQIADFGSDLHRERLRKAKLGKRGPLSNAWRGGPVTLKCLFCKKEFKVYPGRKNKARFCSYSCRSKFYINNLLSKMTRKTDIEHKYEREFRRIRKKIIERDKIDFLTGAKTDLVVHHIDYDRTNNSEWNLITLERRIHSMTNFNREMWKSFFQSQMPAIIYFKGHINYERRKSRHKIQ